jgi:hypothetical protein
MPLGNLTLTWMGVDESDTPVFAVDESLQTRYRGRVCLKKTKRMISNLK